MCLGPVIYDGQKRNCSGSGFRQAPFSNWNRINGKVNFDVNRRDNANWNYAAPSLLR